MVVRRIAVLAALALGAFVPAAHAVFPGKNGVIAFDRDEGCFHESADIYAPNPMPGGYQTRRQPAWSPDGVRLAYYEDGGVSTSKPDGSEHVAFSSPGFDQDPTWSPDGTRVALTSDRSSFPSNRIWAVNADGTNGVELTSAGSSYQPTWSPDGSKISFTSTRDGDPEIFVMNADGTNQVQVTTNGVTDQSPNWSPDGSSIAFERSSEIWRMNADGSGAMQLTSNAVSDGEPAWSPDGMRISFRRSQAIWTMNSVGGDETQVTQPADSCDENPDWQPLPINTYPRPKGATPTYIPLAIAYAPCTSPNREHGAPLVTGSCSPPAQSSGELTVGTLDANDQAAKSVGFADLRVKPGNPSTPADEADVRLELRITDVRKKSDLSDYEGELEARPLLRITDKDNTPSPGGHGAATTADVPFPYTVACAPTTDTTIGSTCSVLTSAEAVLPGSVNEGKRAIWELRRYELYDGGTDGDADTTADNTLFATEGIFVP